MPGHIATISSNVSLDETTIEAGATLQVNSGATLTLLSGTPVMDCYGTFVNAGTISGIGMVFKSGSIYTDNHVGAAVSKKVQKGMITSLLRMTVFNFLLEQPI